MLVVRDIPYVVGGTSPSCAPSVLGGSTLIGLIDRTVRAG